MWGDNPQDLLDRNHPPFRTGAADAPDVTVLGPSQFLYDTFTQMMWQRAGDVHPRGVEGVRLPAYLSPVTQLGRFYDVTVIDRDTERQVQVPLVETVLVRAPLEAAMRQQVDTTAQQTLGVSLL